MSVVTLVNCFEIVKGREDEFFSLWQQVNNYMREKKDTWGTSCTVLWDRMPASVLLMWPNGRLRKISKPPTMTDSVR